MLQVSRSYLFTDYDGNNFISASANVFNLDEEINSNEVATGLVEGIELDTVLSNSFGFGGTNASIALSKFTDNFFVWPHER